MSGKADPGRRGRTTSRTRLDRGRGALGPALELVHTGRAPTRAVLTAELGVTRATAGAVAAELEALGLIRVDARPGAAAGSQGRPSHRLSVAEDGPVALAAQIHADGFRAALVGLGGRIVATAPGCEVVDPDPAKVLGSVVAAAELLRETGRRCVGAGLAVPSAVAEPEGLALNPLHLAWPAGAPVRRSSPSRCAPPASTGPPSPPTTSTSPPSPNTGTAPGGARATCSAWPRDTAASAARWSSTAVCTPAVRASPWRSGTSASTPTAACHCGSRGCLDVEADPLALLTAVGRDPGPEMSLLRQADELIRGQYDDPRVRTATEQLIDRLGLGLAGLVNILNPDRIILGGLHRTLLEADPDRLRAVVADRSLWGRSGGVPILPCTLDHNSLVGAAELAWQPVLDDPLGALA